MKIMVKNNEEEDQPFVTAIRDLMGILKDPHVTLNSPALTYFRDVCAMAASPADVCDMASTPADVKDLPDAYVFIIDMPGVGSGEIKVVLEGHSVLVITGGRMLGEDEEKEKYLRMERWMGRLMRNFKLPVNANTDAISAVFKDGVLTVTVKKLPPPEPRKPKKIEVKIT